MFKLIERALVRITGRKFNLNLARLAPGVRRVTINKGAVIGSTSATEPALRIGGTSDGSPLEIENRGRIQG